MTSERLAKRAYDQRRYVTRRTRFVDAAIEAISESDLAYMAGLIDGDGSIYVAHSPRVLYPCVVVAMADRRVIEWLGSSWAVSVQLHNQTELRRHPTYRRQWRALLTGRRAVRLCERLLPYLRVKAHQARLAVEWPDRRRITAEPVAMMPALWQLVLAEEMAYANEGARD